MTATRTRRILSITPVADGGGSETALVRMVDELTAAGWDCHVAVPAPPRLAARYEAAGATLHIVPLRRLTLTGSRLAWAAGFARGWPVSVGRLASLARRLDVDVVHSNSLHELHGAAAARIAGRPHVWHAREIVVQSAAALRVERAMARHSAAVVAMSGAIAAQLDPSNVQVVLDTPDLGVFTPSGAGRFRAAAGIADDVPLVGAATRIDTWKGVDVLLDAVPALRSVRPDVEVVVAGSAVGGKEAYAHALEARASALGVRWLGHRSDVADVLADLDVFVQLSTEPEPFGLSIVEAFAAGCSVVASDAGGPVEIIGAVPPGVGALVPMRDAAATAAAIAGLLPAVTSTQRRRSRPVVTPALDPGPPLPVLLSRVADAQRPARTASR